MSHDNDNAAADGDAAPPSHLWLNRTQSKTRVESRTCDNTAVLAAATADDVWASLLSRLTRWDCVRNQR